MPDRFTTLAAEQGLTQQQMEALVQHLATVAFIAAIMIAGMLVILTLIIARRLARSAEKKLDRDLSERRPTAFTDTWAAAADRVEVEKNDPEPTTSDTFDLDEDEGWDDMEDSDEQDPFDSDEEEDDDEEDDRSW